jgi:tRNA G18 (ribose-2'-O)-methylase SpoU
VYKTALGAEASVHWLKPIDTIELIQKLKNEGYLIVAIEQAKQAILLHDFDFNMQQKLVFVFGNEVDGVSQEIMNVADACIEIPQGGTKHSINVSVAIGIILWESSKNYNNKK